MAAAARHGTAQAQHGALSPPHLAKAPIAPVDARPVDLRAVDVQLREAVIQRAELDTTLPVVAIVVGGSLAMFAFGVAGMTGLCGIGHSEDSCAGREERERNAILVGVGGVAVMLTGLGWLSIIVSEKHELDARIEGLRTQKTNEVAWNLSVDPRHFEARLLVQF